MYGTFLGGTGNGIDQARGVDVDLAGNAYIVGTTETTYFPYLGGPQRDRRGPSDAVITKLSPEGHLVYSTYLGGDGFDYGAAIAVRNDGVVYAGGATASTNFPVVSPFQSQYGGNTDAFVIELNPQGSAVTKGTYLGGSDTETLNGLELNLLDDEPSPVNLLGDWLLVYGATKSPNFPTANPTQSHRAGDRDGFFTSFDRLTLTPDFSTYAGQPGGNTAQQLVIEPHHRLVFLVPPSRR